MLIHTIWSFVRCSLQRHSQPKGMLARQRLVHRACNQISYKTELYGGCSGSAWLRNGEGVLRTAVQLRQGIGANLGRFTDCCHAAERWAV